MMLTLVPCREGGGVGGSSSTSSSNSGKKNLLADEDYALALARAKHLSLGECGGILTFVNRVCTVYYKICSLWFSTYWSLIG